MNAWGVLGKPSPEKVHEWMNMPYGEFKKMVADVKKTTKGKPLRKHAIEVQDIATTNRSAFVYVEAATGDQAIKLAQLVDKNTMNWSEPKKERHNKYTYRVSQVWD